MFLKQLLAWMLNGDLSDSNEEFFIHHQDKGYSTHDNSTADPGFDWNTSYSIRLGLIPESHLSPRLAAKVLFVGKAVKLLETSWTQTESTFLHSISDQELFEYLSGRKLGRSSLKTHSSFSTNAHLKLGQDQSPSEYINAAVSSQFERKGFTAEDTERFAKSYRSFLTDVGRATEHLEVLINDVNDTISSKLWQLLRDVYGFQQLCHALRNTYLLGKGEFFQTLLDNILLMTQSPVPGSQEIDVLLRDHVLKAAAERHDLDEDSLRAMLQLRVNAPSLTISDFTSENILHSGTSASINQDDIGGAYLCTMPKVEISTAYESLWATALMRSDTLSTQSASKPVYSKGALWLPDHKFVAKGFSASANLSIDWTSVVTNLSPKHSWLPPEHAATAAEISRTHLAYALLLGSAAWVVHCDKLGPRVVGEGDLGVAIFRSVAVGVSFHAVLRSGTVKYFARVFITSNGADSRGDREGSVVAESVLDLCLVLDPVPAGRRSVRANEPLLLEVEYSREFNPSSSATDLSTNSRLAVGGTVSLILKARIREAEAKSASPAPWDVEVPFDIGSVVKLHGGHSFIGVVGSSAVMSPQTSAFTVNIDPALPSPLKSKQTIVSETRGTKSPIFGMFGIKISKIALLGKGSLTTYPVASTYTTTRHPDTYARLDAVVAQLRSWTTLRLRLKVPSIFLVLVDEESLTCYERLFTFAMKVKGNLWPPSY